MDFSKMTYKELISEETICKILDEEHAPTRLSLFFDFEDRAALSGREKKSRAVKLYKAYEQIKEAQKVIDEEK